MLGADKRHHSPFLFFAQIAQIPVNMGQNWALAWWVVSVFFCPARQNYTHQLPIFHPRYSPRMASIVPVAKGYRVQISVNKQRASRTLPTHRAAKDWAAATETAMRSSQALAPGLRHSLRDALVRYRDEVAPTKRGERAERIRVARLLMRRDLPLDAPIAHLSPGDLAMWRDERLREVSPGTVLRELGVIGAMLEVARREWRWIASNPLRDVRKPSAPQHRERVLTWREIRAMARSMGWRPGVRIGSVSQAAAGAFLLALRTGMRAGELCALRWDQVREAKLLAVGTKTGSREVPLSAKAARLVRAMSGWDHERVFGVDSRTLDTLFRRHRQRVGLDGFVFHDTRHTAATWIARDGRLDVLSLCKMFGWRDPKFAMIYYNPTAEDLAARL